MDTAYEIDSRTPTRRMMQENPGRSNAKSQVAGQSDKQACNDVTDNPLNLTPWVDASGSALADSTVDPG